MPLMDFPILDKDWAEEIGRWCFVAGSALAEGNKTKRNGARKIPADLSINGDYLWFDCTGRGEGADMIGGGDKLH